MTTPSNEATGNAGGASGDGAMRAARATRWPAALLLWAACAAVFGAWLAEEWRDLGAWAAARGAVPLDYLRAIPAAAALQWREAGHGWSFPWGKIACASAAILWMLGMHGLGAAALRWIDGRDKRDRVDSTEASPAALALPLGFALVGTVVLLFGLSGWLTAWLFRAVFVATAAIGVGSLLREAARAGAAARTAVVRRALHPANAAVIALAALACVAALAPAAESDGLRYHLGALGEWVKAGRIEFLPHLSFAQFPFLVEMHFLVGLVLWGEPIAGGITAKVMHWGLFVGSLALLAELTRRCAARHGTDHAVAGARLARLAYASMPTALVLAGWSFIDHGIVLYLLAMALALDETRRASCAGPPRRAIAWGAVAGVMAGGLIGTKYTMLVPAGVGGAWLLAVYWRARRDRVVSVVGAFVLGAALIGGPWFARNAAQTGNPIYPATAGIFDASGWPEESAELLSAQMATKGWIGPGDAAQRASWLNAWWHVTTHWRAFEAQCLGPGFALAILVGAGWLALIAWRRLRGGATHTPDSHAPDAAAPHAAPLARLLLLVGVAFYALWYATYLSARQLLPLAAALCIVPGALLAHCRASTRPAFHTLARHLVAAWSLVAASGAVFVLHWFLVGQSPSPLPVALGFEEDTRYLTRAVNYYPLALELNRRQGPGSADTAAEPAAAPRALLLGEHRPYYFEGPILFADWFNPPVIGGLIDATPDNRALLQRLRNEGVAYIALNESELSLYAPLFLRRLGARGAERCQALIQLLVDSAALPTPAATAAIRSAGLANPPRLWLFSVEQALAAESAAAHSAASPSSTPSP